METADQYSVVNFIHKPAYTPNHLDNQSPFASPQFSQRENLFFKSNHNYCTVLKSTGSLGIHL